MALSVQTNTQKRRQTSHGEGCGCGGCKRRRWSEYLRIEIEEHWRFNSFQVNRPVVALWGNSQTAEG